jgi:ABC-type transport system involved in multi-copper enzyme maturation permease subunit
MRLARAIVYLEFPLLRRELVALLRTKTAVIVLIACVALTASLPLLTWPSTPWALGRGWYANLQVFQVFFWTQIAVALLAIPAFTAGAISGERERGTYELLYTTLLPPSSIVLSKLAASSAYVLLLFLAMAPVICALYLLGGLAFGTILRSYAVIFAAVLVSGLSCLAMSMRSERTAQAAVRGIFRACFWNFALALLLALLFLILQEVFGVRVFSFWGQPGYAYLVLISLSPFSVVSAEIYGREFGASFPSTPWLQPWLIFLAYAGLVSLGYVIFLLRAVRTPDMSPSWLRRGLFRGRAKGPPKRRIRRSLSAKLLIRSSTGDWGLTANPIFVKELQSEFFARPGIRRSLFWGLLVIYGGLGLAAGSGWYRDGAEALMVVAVITVLVLGIVVPGIVASGLPREIEQGNLDFLRGTLLGMREILGGKVLAGFYAVSGVAGAGGIAAAAILIGAALLAPNDTDTKRLPEIFFQAGGVVLTTWIALTLVATFASAVSRSTLRALLIAYGALAGFYVVLPLFLALTRWRFHSLDTILEAMNPMGAFGAIARASRGYGNADLTGVALFVVLHLAGAFCLWIASVRFLNARRLRDG